MIAGTGERQVDCNTHLAGVYQEAGTLTSPCNSMTAIASPVMYTPFTPNSSSMCDYAVSSVQNTAEKQTN